MVITCFFSFGIYSNKQIIRVFSFQYIDDRQITFYAVLRYIFAIEQYLHLSVLHSFPPKRRFYTLYLSVCIKKSK